MQIHTHYDSLFLSAASTARHTLVGVYPQVCGKAVDPAVV